MRYVWLAQCGGGDAIPELQPVVTRWTHYNHKLPNIALGGITRKHRLSMDANVHYSDPKDMARGENTPVKPNRCIISLHHYGCLFRLYLCHSDLGPAILAKRPAGGIKASGTRENIKNRKAVSRMGKAIFSKYIKGNLSHPLTVLIKRYTQRIAEKHQRHYPQIAVFSFDEIALDIIYNGRYENVELALIIDYLKSIIPNIDRSAALDFGANIGNHSIYFSKFFERVFAFEPNPQAFDLLKINVKHAFLNQNVICFNFGLSDKATQLGFETSRSNVGASRITSKNNNIFPKNYSLINVKRADELKTLLEEKISLIKVDVEGHELQALVGSSEIIKKNNPVIMFEQHGNEFHNGTSKVVDFLKCLNYKFLMIERSFYFGDNFIFQSIGLILRSVFGYKATLVEATSFKNRFCRVIVAVPKV